MGEAEKKTFVGFGFGPIQSGLFLYEAQASGNFRRLVVAEVAADLVRAVRANDGCYTVNIARADRIDHVRVEGVEIYNPRDPADRAALVEAVAESDEMATCLPSVSSYDADETASVARAVAAGLSRRSDLAGPKPTVIYAAENHNHAAEILRERVATRLGKPAVPPTGPAALENVQVLNTVIGKMSGVIDDGEAIRRIGLETLTPDIPKAVLVEEFNRILISRVSLGDCRRGIDVFREKDDLLPFEEAKLYGHNAVHSLIAYLADLKGLRTIAEAGRDTQIMQTAREAFLAESGQTLIRRHAGLGETLFTPEGYREYAEDLLARMVNPHLNDLVARVGRDPVRKLGCDDRLYGTMRLALDYDVRPVRLALGAAAGVVSMIRRRDELDSPPKRLPATPAELTAEGLRALLLEIWGKRGQTCFRAKHPPGRPGENKSVPFSPREELISMTWEAVGELRGQGYEW